MIEPLELCKYVLVFPNAIEDPDNLVSNFLRTTPGDGFSIVQKHESFGTDGAESFMLLRLPPEDQRSELLANKEDFFIDDLIKFDELSHKIFKHYVDKYNISLSEPTEITHSGMRHYAEGGYVGPHQDYSLEDPDTPNFTVTLNAYLTDDYEGGEIAFLLDSSSESGSPERDIHTTYRPNKGDVVVFPSAMWHKVLPVTAGHRYNINTVLVEAEVPTWYSGIEEK